MKNLKKVIALVAVLAMVLSTVALGATYTDVAEDSAYSTAVESLSKLGIVTGYEDGTYGPEKSVTRAEMAALIARIQGYGETAKAQTNTAFTDVPSSHWASGYVSYAANQNIVNGYGDGTFGPDDTVKYEQAVTMIMRTLGFEYFATTNGGYPTGYLAAATRYGLTDGVSNTVVGSEANRGTIAQLLYNGIDTPIMAPFKWNTNGEVEYAVYDGTDAAYKTLMSENLGVVKIKGVVLANKAVDITGPKSIDLSEEEAVNVHIVDTYDSTNDAFKAYANYTITQMENGVQQYDNAGNPVGTPRIFTKDFLVGDSDIADFIGKRVVLYAVEDKNIDKFVVVSAALDSTTNKTAEFNLDQYSAFVPAATGTKAKVQYFKAETDKDETDLVLENVVNVVYNNVGGYTTALFGTNGVTKNSPYGGKITLVDNNSTSGYDVIFVEVGATAVVDEVNGTKVVFKESAELASGDTINYIKVNAEAEDEIYAFYKDGAEIAVTDLQEWDVLTIVAAADTSDYVVAEVINTTVSGAIGATSSSLTSATGYKYAIDGKKYDVAYGNYKANKLQYGDAGIFYIDKFGKIAAFSEDASVSGGVAGNYGFVLYGAYETSTMKDKVYVIKLLTANGAEIFDVATKVSYYYAGDDTRYTLTSANAFIINGVSGAGAEVKGTTTEFLAGNQFELIKYTTNSAGEINAIYEAGYDADKFAFVANVADDYDADNLKLGKALDENATVFFLASSTTGATPSMVNGFAKNDVINVGGTNYKISTSSCAVGTIADLIDDEDYTGKLYVDNKGELGNLLVVTTGWGKTAASSSIAVVTDVATAQNDDFDACQILSYYVDGELKEGVYTTNDAMDANLTEGDIVKLSVASTGVITAVDILVDFGANIRNANGTIGGTLQKTVNGKDKYIFGYGDAYTKGTKALTIGADTFRLGSAKNVYVVDASLNVGKIDVGAAGDFSWDKEVMTNADKAKYADYVFAREYDGRVEEIVIIKNIIDYTDDTNNITLGDITDVADEYYNAYTAAKAAYDAAVVAYNAAPDATLAAAVNDAIVAAQEAADAAAQAAADAKAEDNTYSTAAADAAVVEANGLAVADGTNPIA